MAPEGRHQFFTGARNTTIHGGTFAVVGRDMHIHPSSSQRHGLELLIANVSQGAFHNAAERGDPPRCHPHTRTAILKEIVEWIRALEAHRRFILWLYGPAGAGKTAIAQTIAEECEKVGLLAASFFFSRTAAGRNNASQFVATLAYQLSRSIPEICEPILAAIEKEPTIFSRTISTQMRALVIEPLASLAGPIRKGPQFVVMDGVDECGPNGKAQAELLNVLGAAVSELRHIPIIFLVGSRPEYDIRLAFNMNTLSSLTKGMVLDDEYQSNADIKLYLNSKFREIRQEQLALGTPLPSSWPAKHNIDRLVKKSSGQFIFASTVIKFIDSRRNPAKCLDIILGLSDPGKETPFAQLDALYHFILSSVEDIPKVLDVLTLLMLGDSYSNELRMHLVDELLGFEVRRVLVDMHALVFVPPPTNPTALLRIHHASLYDFLMDRSRSHDFCIDVTQGHIMISRCWFRILTNYSPTKYALALPIDAFGHHCGKLDGGGLADCLASFDLKALLAKIMYSSDLHGPEWNQFMIVCEEQQMKAGGDFFPRLQNEFHDFILGRFLRYPPSIQAYIPALFDIDTKFDNATPTIQKIFLIVLYGVCCSEAEFTQIQKLDGRLLDIGKCRQNTYIGSIFKRRIKSEQYTSQSSYVALAKEIIRVIHPKPGEAILRGIEVENVEGLFVDYPRIPYNRSTVHNPGETPPLYFADLLDAASTNSDFAIFLRERALQYRYTRRLHKCLRSIALSSLEYIKKCEIPYLRHVHAPGTNRCIVCDMCPQAFVCEDMEDILPIPEAISNNDSLPYLSPDMQSSHSDVKVSLLSDEELLTPNCFEPPLPDSPTQVTPPAEVSPLPLFSSAPPLVGNELIDISKSLSALSVVSEPSQEAEFGTSVVIGAELRNHSSSPLPKVPSTFEAEGTLLTHSDSDSITEAGSRNVNDFLPPPQSLASTFPPGAGVKMLGILVLFVLFLSFLY